jgi:hypothetical protein
LLPGLPLELPPGSKGAATWPKALTARRTRPPPAFLATADLLLADLATPRIVFPTDLIPLFAVTPALLAAAFFGADFLPLVFREGDFFDL